MNKQLEALEEFERLLSCVPKKDIEKDILVKTKKNKTIEVAKKYLVKVKCLYSTRKFKRYYN